VTICQDIPEGPEGGLPADLDWSWYLGQARRKIQKVPGYAHRSRRRLLDHAPALEVAGTGMLPVPKRGKEQPAGSDAKHPTLLWDWPRYPTVGCYTGAQVGILVIDVDDPAKFRAFVDRGNAPLFGDRWKTIENALVSFHGEATAEAVRSGRGRGKLIFLFDGGPDHPIAHAKSRWLKRRGVEVFYGNGLPSILGQYDSNGDCYRIEGTLGEAPDWLVEGLSPKRHRSKAKVPVMTPEDRQAALEGLPAVLAELCPELGNPSVGWRRKDVADDREIWVGRCPFEHDSGRTGDADLDAGYHEEGPYVRCLHGSCVRIQELNQILQGRHRREHPALPPSNHAHAPPAPKVPGQAAEETQAQTLLRLASGAVLYHTAEGRAYASVPINGHIENHGVRSRGFRHWLTHGFYEEQGRPPSSEAMQGTLGTIEAMAHFDGAQQEVHVRVAPGEDSGFLDLGDSSWRVVEIRPDGWDVVDNAPVRFRRPAGLRELPPPRRGGSADSLKPFVNLSDDDFMLLWVWLTAALCPVGPYHILALTGEQGSAKSTLARVARRLVDPHVSLLRGEPKEARDLMITASNSWVVTLDNVSFLKHWVSDWLCRLATGGGLATRTLYADDEETFLDALRPIIINGIEDFVTRGDLSERCLFLHLPAIAEKQRRVEAVFWSEFEALYPSILGALLDAVAGGLKRSPDVRLETHPRMAGFARWGEAVGLALGWTPGRFRDVYAENRKAANELVLEDSPVAGAIRKLVSGGKWTGTSTALMDALAGIVDEKVVASGRWPKSPRGLSGMLRRLAPTLRTVGIHVCFVKEGHARTRTIRVEAESEGPQPSAPSAPSARAYLPGQRADGRAGQPSAPVRIPSASEAENHGVADGRHGVADGRAGQPSASEAEKHGVSDHADAADGADGRIPTFSDEPPF
jgi:hypothetical protein